MPRKVVKRSYRKRPQKARRSRRRFYRRRFYKRNPIKKPEIHILKENYEWGATTGLNKNGDMVHITPISSVDVAGYNQSDAVEYNFGDKKIEGRKIRLKYLYIKGYLDCSQTQQDVNGKLYIFRKKANINNNSLSWTDLIDMPINLSDPTTWTNDDNQKILYCYDWKNDIKGQLKKKIKLFYRAYDNVNNMIPFKIRIPLYDCVLSCDSSYDTTDSKWKANNYPSNNAIFLSFINLKPLTGSSRLFLKTKLYYTDY